MPGVQRAAMRNRAPRDKLELQLQKAGSPRSRQGVETGGRDYFHVGAQAAAAASQSLQSGGRGATPRSPAQRHGLLPVRCARCAAALARQSRGPKPQ